MPIHLTCDFCATTSDVIGHWRFEGKSAAIRVWRPGGQMRYNRIQPTEIQ